MKTQAEPRLHPRKRRPLVTCALAALLGLVGAVGCGGKTATLGGETNWLKTCTEASDCGSGDCLCGVCTQECSKSSGCDDHSDAICKTKNSSSIGAQCGATSPERDTLSGICLPECSQDNDCASRQSCVAGACVFQAGSGGNGGGGEPTGPGDPPGARDVPNPTGDCAATTNGAGTEHSPDPTDTYLPDCALELEREYYRVFVTQADVAYMIPRPDNHPTFASVCTNPEAPFAIVLNRYDLCQKEAFSSSQVDAVNAMAPSDALAIAHFLHERLVFVATENGVNPGARAEDILEACKSDEAFRTGPMSRRCDFEIASEQSGGRDDIGWQHTGEQGIALADKLNELYGMANADLCQRLANDAHMTLQSVIEENRGPCTNDDDCVSVADSSTCHDGCGAVAAMSNLTELEAAKERLASEQCGGWERAECGPVIIRPCIQPLPAACVAGICQQVSPE